MRRLIAVAFVAVAAIVVAGCGSGGEITVKDQETKKAQLDKIAGVDSSQPQEP